MYIPLGLVFVAWLLSNAPHGIHWNGGRALIRRRRRTEALLHAKGNRFILGISFELYMPRIILNTNDKTLKYTK